MRVPFEIADDFARREFGHAGHFIGRAGGEQLAIG